MSEMELKIDPSEKKKRGRQKVERTAATPDILDRRLYLPYANTAS